MGNKIGKGLAQVLHRATYAAVLVIGAAGLIQQASAQVVDTKHNLSMTTPGSGTPGATRTNYLDGGTTQVCVFCHTPHGSQVNAAPLWQRTLASGTSYTTYGTTSSSSMDAEQGTGVTIGSVSLACLSCHDGTQAMNTMSNTPGSGNLATGGGTALATGTWVGSRNNAGKLTGIANLIDGASGANSLQNDHPIGIRYAGGFTYAAGTSVASSAFADKQFSPLVQAPLNGNTVWFVDSGTASGSRDKNDIQLYTRGTSTAAQPYVECSSCHDPHSNAELFLRVTADGSQICLACHIK